MMTDKIFHFVFLGVLLNISIICGYPQRRSNFLGNIVDSVTNLFQHGRPKVDPEVFMNAKQLIVSKGYPEEDHRVVTQDGYILTLQRIPHGINETTSKGEKEVVLLQHGLLDESTDFLNDLANESLAYILADAGADVWLANSRGNSYSKAHIHLKPSEEKFWDWTWDEMAEYDLSSMIEYILAKTGVEQITYIGHSQGTLIGFAGLSQNKALQSRVKLFIALAPIAKVGHIKSPLKVLAPFADDIQKLEKMLGKGEIMPRSNSSIFMAKDVCKPFGGLCEAGFFIVGGFDLGNLNKSRVPVYVAHNPSGTSVRNLIHYAQAIKHNTFQKYNFPTEQDNLEHYGQRTPPTYFPENIDTPIAVFRGGNDWLSDPDDVRWLLPKIKNLVFDRYIPHWMHVDFIYGKDAPELCYKSIKQLIFDKAY